MEPDIPTSLRVPVWCQGYSGWSGGLLAMMLPGGSDKSVIHSLQAFHTPGTCQASGDRLWREGSDCGESCLIGPSEGRGSLVCHSPWGRKEPDTTKWPHNSNKSPEPCTLPATTGFPSTVSLTGNLKILLISLQGWGGHCLLSTTVLEDLYFYAIMKNNIHEES